MRWTASNANSINGSIKKGAVLSSTTIILFLALVSIPPSFAATLDYTGLATGPVELKFRDILITEDTSVTVLTLNPTSYHVSDTVTINIKDHNANVAATTVESITATVGSSPTTFLETGVNTGNFAVTRMAPSGAMGYDSVHPAGVGRATVNFDLTTGGTVRVEDSIIPAGGGLGCVGFEPVIHPVKITFPTAVMDPATFSITLSYADGILAGGNPELLKMWFRATGGGWELVTEQFDDPLNPDAHNFVALTVKTDATIAGIAGFGGTFGAGEYVLGFVTGCGGGGAGGLVQPGLVLNFLAGTLAGAGGRDNTPPSLTRPVSSGVQFDPFTPIEQELTGPADTTQQAPLRINGNNYPLYGYSNTIVKNTIKTGQFTDMSLAFEEASKVEHVAMYFVDQGSDEYSETDPALIFDKGNIAKADPEGIFGDDIQLSTSKEGSKSIFNFGVSFDKPTNKNLMIVAWDDKRNSGVTKIFNAIEVVGNEIPNEVSHFMPTETLGEFDLVKIDNGQYVLSQPVATETVTPDSPKSVVYPEFIGRLERHDFGQLADAISYEQQKASDLMVGKFNLDISHRFVADDEVKPYDMPRRASELTMCGNKIGCGFDRENKELIQKLLWQEHLKAEKMLESLLVESKYHQD